MPLIDCGHRYTVAPENFNVPITTSISGNAQDLLQLATTSSVPIFVDYINVSGNLGSGSIQRLQVVRRSATSTSGSATPAKPDSPASPAAATTCLYSLTATLGALGDAADSKEWNQFADYEYSRSPSGILVPPSSFLNIFLPAPPAALWQCSIRVSFVELR